MKNGLPASRATAAWVEEDRDYQDMLRERLLPHYDAAAYLDVEGAKFVTKPIDEKTLLSAIRALVDWQRSGAELAASAH